MKAKPSVPSVTFKSYIPPILVVCSYLLLAGTVLLALRQSLETSKQESSLDKLSLEEKVQKVRNLSEADRKSLLEIEGARLVATPLNRNVLENLGVVTLVSGDEDLSEKYITLAAQRTLHDTSIQILAVRNALKSKNYQSVLYRLDGLARINLNNRKFYYGIIQNLAEHPDSIQAVADYIAQLPPWREEFLKYLANETKQVSAMQRLFVAMRKTREPPSVSEIRPLYDRLVREKNFDQLYFIWLDSLTPQELSKSGNVFDGDFDTNINNLYFGWTYTPIKNAQARIVPRASGSADRVLRVDFANSKIPFYNFLQFLKLTSGVYELRGKQMAANFTSSGGLVWAILCADTGEFLGQGHKMTGSTSWQTFSFPFTIPPNNCETQYLRLQAASSAPLDQQFRGAVFFDDLAIDRR